MKNKLVILTTILLSFTLFSIPAIAYSQSLGTCLVDSLNGKERKQLAKWIYFAIAAHPEMKSFSNISGNDRITTDRYVGKLVTRLLVEDCSSSLVTAQKADPLALQKAFELVGQVAMQELMNNQEVTTAISSYANYADLNKISTLLGEQ
ncbi:hypothetical protein KAH27_06255 [bacterium]|nr:hypothetical protein [bacterium]